METAKTNRPVALVTGSAKRVGRAVALELARAGYDIVIHYNRSTDEAQRTAEQVKQEGASAIVVHGDLLDPSTPQHIIEESVKHFGRLDVLVNNASVFERMLLEEFDFQQWHDCMHVNLAAPIRLCQLSAVLMKQQGSGCIINFCDAGTQHPWKDYLAYGPSKAGLSHVTKALARSLAPTIRVNGVAPGIAVFPEDYSTELKRELVERVPLKREGTPEEMARAVRFLVESDYITGQIIHVDGGRNIM